MKPKKPSARSYSHRTLKILWGRAAGRCAVPECRAELIVDATDHDPVVVIGDIAHIEASSNKGPRANRKLTTKDRHSYANLILLCKNCHVRFDGQKRTNTVGAIRTLRTGHEDWVRASLPERGLSATGWHVLILQGSHPIDAAQTVAALSPDFPKGKPTTLATTSARPWSENFARMANVVRGFLAKGDSFDSRFAVFPLAPVTACIAAGYLLTNRPRVRLFQHHRAKTTWVWPTAKAAPSKLKISGLPSKRSERSGSIAVCFHLSARISHSDVPIPKRSLLRIIDVSVPAPDVLWLKSPHQLDALGAAAGSVFESLQRHFPNASHWHLFYAGPAPGAIKVGQQLNPTMTPPVQLYEYNRSGSPRYEPSLCLTP